jgi:thymidylate synthase ThyX
MSISAKVIADSVSPVGVRLTTLQLSYPRFVHSEVLTHRVFSRNAASSRAIPIQKMIQQVMDEPALPVFWGKNQSGMQAREELPEELQKQAELEWRLARVSAVQHAQNMVKLGVHKQIVNRLLEPWQEMHTIVTATEWTNWNNLRRHADAQPEIKALADAMHVAMSESLPRPLAAGEWHLPYVPSWNNLDQAKKCSTARCARVSYLNHDKSDPDPHKDEGLHDTLLSSGHFSPFEHQATPGSSIEFNANFKGWVSYRRTLGF